MRSGSSRSFRVRPPAVAGAFYPGEASALRAEVERMRDQLRKESPARK